MGGNIILLEYHRLSIKFDSAATFPLQPNYFHRVTEKPNLGASSAQVMVTLEIVEVVEAAVVEMSLCMCFYTVYRAFLYEPVRALAINA